MRPRKGHPRTPTLSQVVRAVLPSQRQTMTQEVIDWISGGSQAYISITTTLLEPHSEAVLAE